MSTPARRASHWSILIALVAGAAGGAAANALVGDSGAGRVWLDRVSDGVAYPIGQVFLRGLILVVMPLVFASLALGVGELPNLRKLGSLGSRTLVMFLLTTLVWRCSASRCSTCSGPARASTSRRATI